MNMWIDFENAMDMGMDIGITFENKYGCEYSYTRPEPTSRPTLKLRD